MPFRAAVTDLLARLVTGFLFVLLTANLFQDFLETRRLTGLMLVLSEALVVVFTIFRRKTHIIDRSPFATITTVISLAGPPLLRSSHGDGLVGDDVTTLLSIAGLCVVIAGKMTLGRSFGLIPANRGVVASGPYLIVRHPIYAGYLATHIGFILAYPTLTNLMVLVIADTALVIRALFEERVLSADEEYRAYCGRVGWHLVPGIF